MILLIGGIYKMVQMNLFSKQKQNHRCRKQSYTYQQGRGRGIIGEIKIDIDTLLNIN